MRLHSYLLVTTAAAAVATPALAQPQQGDVGATKQEQVAQQANQQPARQNSADIIVPATQSASTIQDAPLAVLAKD